MAIAPPPNTKAYSSTYSEGIKLLIHSSSIYPSDLSIEEVISHRSESIVRIKSTFTMCALSVRELPTADRECIFSPEQKLR